MMKGMAEALDGKVPKVYVIYTGTYFIERRQGLAAERLFKYYGVSAVSCLCNTVEMNNVAERLGKLSVAVTNDLMAIVGPSVISGWTQVLLPHLKHFVTAAMAGIPWGKDTSNETGFEAPPNFYLLGLGG